MNTTTSVLGVFLIVHRVVVSVFRCKWPIIANESFRFGILCYIGISVFDIVQLGVDLGITACK